MRDPNRDSKLPHWLAGPGECARASRPPSPAKTDAKAGSPTGAARVAARRRATLGSTARALLLTTAAAAVLSTCGHSAARFPWPAAAAKSMAPEHAEVVTANRSYRRDQSQVLVRSVTRATRANLDYAAYHANFMNADPAPEGAAAAGAGSAPNTSNPFEGALEQPSLTSDLGALPLSPEERTHPLALPPLVEYLTSKHVPGGEVLEDVASKIRAEDWGLGGGPQLVRQAAVGAYLHQGRDGQAAEIWIQVEFASWFKGFVGMPDADGDGYGELYGRVPAAALGDKASALVAFIRNEYAGKVLSPAEVKGWAHQLASYWYPSYNTDLVTPGASWPDADTEADVVAELGKQLFPSPTVVMRGKPQGKPVYNIFIVSGAAAATAGADSQSSAKRLALPRSQPSADPAPVVKAIRAELADHAGSWSAWVGEAAPLHQLLRQKVKEIPSGAKATAGSDGFLFFGQSMAYVVGGDLEKQRRGRNPVPAIVQFKKLLAEHGVDLLFVPVPTKEEVFPDKIATTDGERTVAASFVGKVVNPYARKFLLDLSEKGVEVVDLLPELLRARAGAKSDPAAAALFQAQDTHWTNRGLELAARVVGQRVKRYPWYKGLAAHRQTFSTKPAKFSRHGDLHSRLPEADKARYQPENLVGDQVTTGDGGTLYEDDPDSPVVVLGDSFTGVYELMDCEHAGVSAHLAKEIGYPVDLVMSYGGGPNVRQKLLRRGTQALDSKKLVIWMMTARDLYDFWEGWQPVAK